MPKVPSVILKLADRILSRLPKKMRDRLYRSLVNCEPPSQRLVLKIAETQEELEACFRLLHDAYVDSGFMVPDPSGMRVTIYHALPTTTTLCAKIGNRVVGTVSLIRESSIGFPLQRIFDLTDVRSKEGQIAEVSALAVHPKFRRSANAVLLPLVKFMYEYSTTFFDTRHLVIAVNPRHIGMYESMVCFKRLTANVVDNYDFVNGAPAVGATLDLKYAPEELRQLNKGGPDNRNMYKFFCETKLPNIQMPRRRFFTTNDPVMTPQLIDHFFNKKTTVFADLDDRHKALLHQIYDSPEYRSILPAPPDGAARNIRQHRRFSVKCPAQLISHTLKTGGIQFEVHEVSRYGFRARLAEKVPADTWLNAIIQLGPDEVSRLTVQAVQVSEMNGQCYCGFRISEPDLAWRKFVAALYDGNTHADLDDAARFLA